MIIFPVKFSFIVVPFYAAPLRAPKWYKRPAGASFGFGGKLVGFRPRPSGAGVPAGASEVSLLVNVSLFSYFMLYLFVNFFPSLSRFMSTP